MFNDFDDNNLFDDSFDLLQQSGDSLFAPPTPKAEEKKQEAEAVKEEKVENTKSSAEKKELNKDDKKSKTKTKEEKSSKQSKEKKADDKTKKAGKSKKKKNEDNETSLNQSLIEEPNKEAVEETITNETLSVEQPAEQELSNLEEELLGEQIEEVINTEEQVELQAEENIVAEEQIEEQAQENANEEQVAQIENKEQEPKTKKRGRKKKNIEALEEPQDEAVQPNVLVEEGVEETTEVLAEEEQPAEQEVEAEQSQEVTENNKEKKEKKKINKKKLIIISVICGAVLALAIAIVLLCINNANMNKKLLTPNFDVYQRGYGTTLVIDHVDNAKKYEVVIIEDNNETTFTSTKNSIDLVSYLNQPGEFTIKVRALGATENAHSDYSEEKVIVNYIKLETPTVFMENDIITWNTVSTATSYYIYYMANWETDSVEYYELTNDNSSLTFDLTILNSNGMGEYNVYVQAIAPDNTYYVNSDYSNTTSYVYSGALQTPTSATYNSQTNVLKFNVISLYALPAKFTVKATLNDGDYTVKEHTLYANELECVEQAQGFYYTYKYTANFTDFFEYDVLSMTICSQSSNVYEANSTEINVIVN